MKLILIVALLGLSTPAMGKGYLCVGDLSTGFRWDGKRWAIATFNVDKDKFAVKIEGLDVTVTRIGNQYPTHSCTLPNSDAEQFACGGLGYGFVMNLTSLRYQEYYGLGYVDSIDAASDTPALSIGRCSPL